MRDPVDFVYRCIGALERRAGRKLQDHEHIALILVGHEAGRTRLDEAVERSQQHGER